MSGRLGSALAEYLRRELPSGERSFVLVEGVPTTVAEGMSRGWDDSLPLLSVVSSSPALFPQHAMRNVSGTQLRNQRDTRGVVLVLCDGEQVPDRQSLNLFESVSPSVLLESAENMAILSQQSPAVDLDGPARAVREAINQADVATRPSATSVAEYLDHLAAGDDPLEALPVLGAFTDHAGPGERVDSTRITDNLILASRRTSDDFLRPAAYADLRKRAEAVLRRRPGIGDAGAPAAAEDVMTELQAGSPDLLRTLRFDEAREIMEQRPQDLPEIVRREMRQFRAGLPSGSQAEDLPWHTYEQRAEQLRRGAQQRDAARDLCDLDDAQQRRLFTRQTRTKLERLLRDKAVNGSNPSCPEAAIVKAAQQLGGLIERVQVLSPPLPTVSSATNRTGAGRILTLACTRLRLGALMHAWSSAGGEVDGLLLRAADDDDLVDVLAAFGDAGLSSGTQLPLLQLRLHGQDGSTAQVDWRPDLDDVATLRAAILFAEAPALTLTLHDEPTLHAFCGAENAVAQPVSEGLIPLARQLQTLSRRSLDSGLEPKALKSWAAHWTQACAKRESDEDSSDAESLAVAGAVRGGETEAALTAFAPMKAEWLAQYLEALWGLVRGAEEPKTSSDPTDAVATANGIARTTAAHHPAHLRTATQDRALLPTSEGRIWSLYGGASAQDESGFAGEALSGVVMQLLKLQPEAAGHLRCLAWGPGAADLLVSEAVKLIGRRAGNALIRRIEVFCVGTEDVDKPDPATLAMADDQLRNGRDVLELRYLDDLDRARSILSYRDDTPAVHLALVTGLTEGGNRLQVESPEVSPPAEDAEVLFAPRVWQRPRQDRRTLLMPPAASPTGQMWLRLQNAVEDAWAEPDQPLRVPEVRAGALDIATKLQQVHDLALWVATLDRYATRDSLEQALGADRIAILHQERRLGGDSPLSLVISQKSGGPADRAIGRSLRAAGIIAEPDVALSIGTQLRKVASQGYGILALQAATSGAGINELVGHVVAFSLLATTTTPWPLPPGCRVLLVSLDEYRHWFPGKRADLLAIALDTRDEGVHVATIEVKARRSDENDAAAGALDQLNQTLASTKWAAYPEANSVHSRLWLNRIAEAAYAVARESRFKLDADELRALEAFRLGRGSLEWAGVGLVFGPKVEPMHRTYRANLANDIVPVVLRGIPLTEDLPRDATNTSLTRLRTVKTDAPPLQSTRTKRRPESGSNGGRSSSRSAGDEAFDSPAVLTDDAAPPPPATPPNLSNAGPSDRWERSGDSTPTESVKSTGTPNDLSTKGFHAPLLGWDAISGEEIRWHPAGPGQHVLQNGHTEIWGSSGMGKTQFTMSLLGQLSKQSGTRFGIADFKNDYSDDTGFPKFADARFIDLWNGGARYNPLALEDDGDRAIQSAVIELRDTVDEAVRSVSARLGVRQRAKLEKALQAAYSVALSENRWPTLRTLDDQLDDDLAGVIGDLTHNDLFKSGEPLGNVIDQNVVFGLSKIPGNGQTTVLAAGFIFSALLLRVQNLPPVPNTIRYVLVADEAHRVAPFRAIQTMIREGRSKGLAVVLATQGPLDLPDVVAANAQTKICFGLPDATVATMAARKLQPDNSRLPEQIRTLGKGEAFVSFAGDIPRLVRMAQAYRDAATLGLPPLG
jgi:Bacterial protein of unknown function (DUF853)